MNQKNSQIIDSSYAEFISRKIFANLNGLRFICIVAVLWHHSPLQDHFRSSYILAGRGFLGVDFFFVLSGFLITSLILREMRRTGSFSLKNFYIRRSLRILPAYLLLLAIVIGIYVVIKGERKYLDIVPAYLFFGANFISDHIPTLSITWSLSVEEQYYLLWPLLLLLLPSRFLIPALVAAIAVNLGLMLVELSSGTPVGWKTDNFHFKLPNSTYTPILLGSLLAVLLNAQQSFKYVARALNFRGSDALTLAALVLLLFIFPSDLRGWPNLAIHIVMTAVLAALVVTEKGYLAAFFQNRQVARIGEISYGIYLYHLLADHAVRVVLAKAGMGDQIWIHLLAYCVASIAVAEMSFRYYESWFLNQRGRFGDAAAQKSVLRDKLKAV
jgi:peptidoglycan/LPS O-acetylase OafA/YrhL